LTDITVAQAAIIEDHAWALMEALGVRDSLRINRRISEAIGTVLDRQRDALPETDTQVGDEWPVCEGPCLLRTFRSVNGPNYSKCVVCGRRPFAVTQ
jgi:hypothetical protein